MTKAEAIRWAKREAPLGLSPATLISRLWQLGLRDPHKRATVLEVYRARK